MQYDYVVILKRENAHRTDLVSLLLIIFSLVAFTYVQIRQGLNGFLCTAIVILLLGLFFNLNKRRKGQEMRFRNWLFATALFWLGVPSVSWIAILFVLFALLEAQAKYPLEIGFYGGGVVLNTLFKKKWPWSSLDTVMLRDGLLTLDFKDNTLIQKEVLDDDEPDAPEEEFNEYCRSKLVIL